MTQREICGAFPTGWKRRKQFKCTTSQVSNPFGPGTKNQSERINFVILIGGTRFSDLTDTHRLHGPNNPPLANRPPFYAEPLLILEHRYRLYIALGR
jgi:hypothetical protein